MEKKKEKKYGRREVIGYGTRVVAGATIYGLIGNFLGNIYESARDNTREVVREAEEVGNYVKDVGKKAGKVVVGTKDVLYDTPKKQWSEWIFGKKEKHDKKKYALKKKEPQKQEPISRRSFLKKIVGVAHEHPVEAGTTVGIVYGAQKSARKGYTNYKIGKGNAELNKKLDRIEERLNNLSVVHGDLEKRTSQQVLLFLGVVGMILSIFMGSLNLTGFAISYFSANSLKIINSFVFVVSLFLVFFANKKFKKNY